jgi:HEAT repeat protein
MADTVISALIDQMPPLGGDGKLVGPARPEAEKVYDQVLAAGRDGLLAVIGLLKGTDDGSDYRARYVLEGLAAYVCRADRKDQRAVFVQTLASQLSGDRPKAVVQFLIRRLQTAGDKSAVESLAKLLSDDALANEAVAALTAIGQGAAEPLRAALPTAKGVCRLAIIQALGVLKDGDSLAAFKQAAGDADREIRLAAVWALANIGDAGSVGALIKASSAEGWERIQATKACLVLAENLLAAGKKDEAARLCKHLCDSRTDKAEEYVKQAASRLLSKVQ